MCVFFFIIIFYCYSGFLRSFIWQIFARISYLRDTITFKGLHVTYRVKYYNMFTINLSESLSICQIRNKGRYEPLRTVTAKKSRSPIWPSALSTREPKCSNTCTPDWIQPRILSINCRVFPIEFCDLFYTFIWFSWWIMTGQIPVKALFSDKNAFVVSVRWQQFFSRIIKR